LISEKCEFYYNQDQVMKSGGIFEKSLNVGVISQITSFITAIVGVVVFVVLFKFVKPKYD
jgi:hypothetical protein